MGSSQKMDSKKKKSSTETHAIHTFDTIEHSSVLATKMILLHELKENGFDFDFAFMLLNPNVIAVHRQDNAILGCIAFSLTEEALQAIMVLGTPDFDHESEIELLKQTMDVLHVTTVRMPLHKFFRLINVEIKTRQIVDVAADYIRVLKTSKPHLPHTLQHFARLNVDRTVAAIVFLGLSNSKQDLMTSLHNHSRNALEPFFVGKITGPERLFQVWRLSVLFARAWNEVSQLLVPE